MRGAGVERTLSESLFSGAVSVSVTLPETVLNGITASVLQISEAPRFAAGEVLTEGGVVVWLREAGGAGAELACADDKDMCLSITQGIVIRADALDMQVHPTPHTQAPNPYPMKPTPSNLNHKP